MEIHAKTDLRLEFINGEIVVLESPTADHQEISGNLYMLLRSHLQGSHCKVYYSIGSWIPRTNASWFTVLRTVTSSTLPSTSLNKALNPAPSQDYTLPLPISLRANPHNLYPLNRQMMAFFQKRKPAKRRTCWLV